MTMKTPEMEVVRFNESDVVCASKPGPVQDIYYAEFGGLGPAAKNATLNITSNSGSSDFSWDELEKIDKTHVLGQVIFYNGTDTNAQWKSLYELIEDEMGPCSYGQFNGAYKSTDEGRNYFRQ